MAAVDYLVDNTQLQAKAAGLAYRNSPVLTDKVRGNVVAPWGSTVRGSPINDEWVKAEQGYLPITLQGSLVLKIAGVAKAFEPQTRADPNEERPRASSGEALEGALIELSRQLRESEARKAKLMEQLAPVLARKEKARQNVTRPRWLVRTEAMLSRNIARDMRAVKEGRIMHKVSQRHATSEQRLVEIHDEEMLLKWGHAPGPLGRDAKAVDLHDVIELKFGHATQIKDTFPNVMPWLCFSLRDKHRSYDFICPDDVSIQSFMIVLSRLCVGATGRVDSKKKFLVVKAWCKIRERCLKQKKPLTAVLLEAIKKAGAKNGGPGLNASAEQSPDEGDYWAAPLGPSMKDATGVGIVWPKEGEAWHFTGTKANAVVYDNNAESKKWVNQLSCRGKGGDRRGVKILSNAEKGSRYVEVQGTGNMSFVQGWIELIDENDTWLLEKEADAKLGLLAGSLQTVTRIMPKV